MRGLWLGLMIALAAAPAAAREVAIRSGEHRDFSRLVLAIGEGMQWRVETSDRAARLRLSDPEATFQTAGIFERLPRQRLEAVTDAGDGVLALRLACNPCHVDPFLWRPGRLVLDIVDGPDPDRSEDNTALTTSALRLPLVPDGPRRAAAFLLPGAFAPDAAASAPADPRVATMAREVARAVSAGYLAPSVESPTALPRATEPPPEPPTALETAPSPPVATGAAQPGLSLGNALDRDLAAVNAALTDAADRSCLASEAFDVAAWAADQGFARQIGKLRRDLVTEFDRPSHQALLRLARGYVHFGLGREARATLARGNADDPARAALAEMARVVDGRAGDFPVLSAQAGCDNGAGPWSLLSGTVALDALDRNGVIRAFRLLPQPLQSHLATDMAGAFLAAGDVDAAALVFMSLQGRDAARTPAAQRMRAALLEAGGETDAALGVLDEAAAGRAEAASLIRLIDLTLESDARPSAEDTSLAAALLPEYRGTPTELRLAAAKLRAHVARAEWDKARGLLTRYADRWPDPRRAALAKGLFRRLAETAAAPPFLGMVFADLPQDLDAMTVNTLAARLLEEGFPERAIELLNGPAEGEAMAERRYLRAAAALQLGRDADVLLHLAGMTQPRALGLRAQALFELGDARGALAALPDPPDPQADFRAGAWDRLAASDDPLLRRVAERALSKPDQAEMADLAARRDALDEARQTRRTLDELLDRFPAEPAEADAQ